MQRVKSHWHDRIESDPRILKGKPCIKGSRIPVALIPGFLPHFDLIGELNRFSASG
jgi:uncharacterized protein (DUF433 family)